VYDGEQYRGLRDCLIPEGWEWFSKGEGAWEGG
jgi:hypothetical protein